MATVPETIAIRNPRILEVVGEEMEFGAGRNATEAAENLILASVEDRRVRRAVQQRDYPSQASESDTKTPQPATA
jgi:hypothetical protein